MKRVDAEFLMRTFDMYIKLAKEYAKSADTEAFSPKIYVLFDGTRRYVRTPPLINIKLNDYGMPFCGLYMTRAGGLWVEDYSYMDRVFHKYLKEDRSRLLEQVKSRYETPAFRLNGLDYGIVNTLCLLSYIHHDEYKDRHGNGYTYFNAGRPRSENEIESGIRKHLSKPYYCIY